MRKSLSIIFIILISFSIFWLGFGYNKIEEPNIYYQVFLDGELLGTVTSSKKLEKYIDSQNEYIKNKYKVDKVYSPLGLKIEKVMTYSNEVDGISELYDKIKAKKAFTIRGYQMTIIDGDNNQVIYATNTDIFSEALENTIKTFVGTENYSKYLNNSQDEIKETGTVIENVYIQNSKTLKEVNISVDEKIYIDADELSQYLIFGDNAKMTNYIVKFGDTISSVAFNNKISVEELLLSNDDLTSSKNILYVGQNLKIKETNPQVKVVVEEFTIEDVENKFTTIEQYDYTLNVGNNQVIQAGSNGVDRVTKNVQKINGTITYVNTESKVQIKPTVNKIVAIGQKIIPNIGTSVWGWPTNGGWTISSDFGWRINPINGVRELHDGIDIAGTGYGSPIYATNNGTVYKASYHYVNGNYVMINHNNGYYSYYGHMSQILVQEGQTVARGDIIGLIGQTGWATGPHVHYGIYDGIPLYTGTPLNPWTFY